MLEGPALAQLTACLGGPPWPTLPAHSAVGSQCADCGSRLACATPLQHSILEGTNEIMRLIISRCRGGVVLNQGSSSTFGKMPLRKCARSRPPFPFPCLCAGSLTRWTLLLDGRHKHRGPTHCTMGSCRTASAAAPRFVSYCVGSVSANHRFSCSPVSRAALTPSDHRFWPSEDCGQLPTSAIAMRVAHLRRQVHM